MEIVTLAFEESLVVCIKNNAIKLTVFKTLEHGNVKIGIKAPSSISVNREEIHFQKQQASHEVLAIK